MNVTATSQYCAAIPLSQCCQYEIIVNQAIWQESPFPIEVIDNINNYFDLQRSINTIQANLQREQSLGIVAGKCIRAFTSVITTQISLKLCKMVQKLDLEWFRRIVEYGCNRFGYHRYSRHPDDGIERVSENLRDIFLKQIAIRKQESDDTLFDRRDFWYKFTDY